MANLRDNEGESDRNRNRNRGQLILVTAVAISVALVALVILLNGAIYAENVATRDAGADGPAALAFEENAVESVGGIVERENAAEHENHEEVWDRVSTGIDRYEALVVTQELERGAGVRIENVTAENGTLIRHTDPEREFTNESGEADWTLSTSVSNVRGFTATVDRDELNETSEANAEDAFHVVLNGSNDQEWRAYVYDDDDADNVTVAVERPEGGEGGPTEVCSRETENATVDFTAGTLAGEPCDGLNWAVGIDSPYDVEYVNGDRAVGTYEMTIEDTDVVDDNLNDGPSAESPYQVPAVYSVTVDLHRQTPELRYGTEIRVAPGEPDA